MAACTTSGQNTIPRGIPRTQKFLRRPLGPPFHAFKKQRPPPAREAASARGRKLHRRAPLFSLARDGARATFCRDRGLPCFALCVGPASFLRGRCVLQGCCRALLVDPHRKPDRLSDSYQIESVAIGSEVAPIAYHRRRRSDRKCKNDPVHTPQHMLYHAANGTANGQLSAPCYRSPACNICT